MKKILLIEDDPAIRMALQDSLEIENYEVISAANGIEGFEYASHDNVDMILLDLMLPGMSGEDICRELRGHGIDTPIIVLSCKGDLINKVLTLEIGADDFLPKPFSMDELHARIHAVLRRSRPRTQHRRFLTTPIRRLSAIMFTHMVGYSALTQRNESLAVELLDEHRRLLRSIFPQHRGLEIDSSGDGFFVEFESALEATQCAIGIQSMFYERNLSTTTERQLQIRIGLHLGDVIHIGNDVKGDGVNIAARLEPLAEPGGIFVSEDIARQVHNKIDLPILELGPSNLKNIECPVTIYKIILPWQ